MPDNITSVYYACCHVASNTCEVVNCLSGGDAVSGHTHVLTKVAGAGGHVPHVQGDPIRS